MAGWDIVGNVKAEVPMYVGGGGMAAVAHYADQAAPVSFLAKQNITNSEGLFLLDVISGALFRNKIRSALTKGIMDASVAYSTGAMVDRYLKGRFTASGSGGGTPPAVEPTSHTTTGYDAMDPSLGWGGSSGGAGGFDMLDSRPLSGYGID